MLSSKSNLSIQNKEIKPPQNPRNIRHLSQQPKIFINSSSPPSRKDLSLSKLYNQSHNILFLLLNSYTDKSCNILSKSKSFNTSHMIPTLDPSPC